MFATIILSHSWLSPVHYAHQGPNRGFKEGHRRVGTNAHRYIYAAGILKPDNRNFLIHSFLLSLGMDTKE